MNKKMSIKDTDKLVVGWYELSFPSGINHYIYVQDNIDYECDYTMFEVVQGKMTEIDGGVISADFDTVDLWYLKEFIYGELYEEFNNTGLKNVVSSLLLNSDGDVIDTFEEGYELVEKGA